jgi:membrane protein YqaA with SNARE-associated domain
MLRALYDRTLKASAHPHAERWLAAVSFIESSVFPIPPDVMLIPMVLADRAKAWRIALICTIASVLGGLLGYAIGSVFFDLVGQPILDFYSAGEKFVIFQEKFADWGAWAVFFAGVTPFPYKVITIASGFVHLDLLVFVVASVLARGLRFFLVAGLLWYFGEPIRTFIEAHLGKLTILFFVLLLGGFLVVKWLI